MSFKSSYPIDSRDGDKPDYHLIASGKTPEKDRHKPSLSFSSVVFFILGIAWLAPAIYLLYLNLSGYILGASAWCYGADCPVIDYSNDSSASKSFQRAARANDRDRNLQGGLQFAAKAMEVWFMVLVANLVYHISFMPSRQKHGMPLGYALMHVEVSNLITIFRRPFWAPVTSARSSDDGAVRKRGVRASAIPLVLALALLCIVANIISPSIAVLMIPTLNWFSVEIQPARVTGAGPSASSFDSTFASTNPGDLPEAFVLPGCTPQDLASNQFSCTSDIYGQAWDILAENVARAGEVPAEVDKYLTREAGNALKRSLYVPSTEFGIPFSFNATAIDDTYANTTVFSDHGGRSYDGVSTPVRQTLRELANDMGLAYEDVQNSSHSDLKNSLELRILREGPVIGSDFTTGYGYSSVMGVGDSEDDRSIYCLYQTMFVGRAQFTRCFQVGTGWNQSTDYASFFYDDQGRNLTAGDEMPEDLLEVSFVGVNRGLTYLDSPPPCLIPSNQSDRLAPDACDWDELFSQPNNTVPSQGLTFPDGPSSLVLMVGPPFQYSDTPRIIVPVSPVVHIATYSLDITTISPFLDMMQYSIVPEFQPAPITSIHPNWMLAGWSVSGANTTSNGTRTTGTTAPIVTEPRPSLKLLSQLFTQFKTYAPSRSESLATFDSTLESFSTDRAANLSRAAEFMAIYTGASVLHALSMIPYNTTSEPDGSYPMRSWVERRAWKYGLDSRSRQAATVVMFVAVLVVLAWAVVFVRVRTEERPVAVILASALRHSPGREFEGETMGSVEGMRFTMREGEGDGFLEFRKTK